MITLSSKRSLLLFFTALYIVISFDARAAEDIRFPADAGVVNVKTAYGAKGDGITTDDTAALQAAIDATASGRLGSPTLYLPNGTYLVSNTLSWPRYLTLQGQSRDGTVIKLKNSASMFGDPNSPKAVIFTGQAAGTRTNTAFGNKIFNLTVDTGRGNPGAIGIDYTSNNQGSIRDVMIRSGDGNGKLGLSLLRDYPGPALAKRLTIDGYQTGIDAKFDEYGMTFEHLTIRNFTVAGVRNQQGQMLAIRNLVTSGSGPAILQQNSRGSGLIVVIGGQFNHTYGPASSAIDNNGRLYLRQVSTAGYQHVLPNTGTTITEYASHAALHVFASPSASLNLPIEETPEMAWDTNFSHWANIMDYGANPYDSADDSAAIQKAIDSGKPIIYFPLAKAASKSAQPLFVIGKTIILRGNVRRIIGFGGAVHLGDPLRSSSAPIFRMQRSSSAVLIDSLSVDRNGANSPVFLEHVSPGTVVVRNAGIGHAYRATAGAGHVFIEDVSGSGYQFVAGQNIWARQMNPEGSTRKVLNNGANLWVLGLKTERASTAIETRHGGSTELLGATIGWATTDTAPLFINEASRFTASYFKHGSGSYKVHVRETRGGVTKELLQSEIPSNYIPFYTGYAGRSASPSPPSSRSPSPRH